MRSGPGISRLRALALLPALLAATPAVAGEALGPVTRAPKTRYSVTVAHPRCEGNFKLKGVGAALIKRRLKDPSPESLLKAAGRVIPRQAKRDHANCVPVCAVVPRGAKIAEVVRYWDPAGDPPDLDKPYPEEEVGRWGPEPVWHRWDPGFDANDFGRHRLVCTLFRNWSRVEGGSARIRVVYE